MEHENQTSEESSTAVRSPNPNLDTEVFISKIVETIKSGIGFVPIIGAGVSAPSGIPLIRELSDYLNRCIALSLKLGPYKQLSWNPDSEWPGFEDPLFWQDLELTPLTQLMVTYEVNKGKQDSNPGNLVVYQEAIGAMADWKTALLFLSRLQTQDNRLWLASPNYDIIDSFFRSVIADKSPMLVHQMLAQLALPLRMHTIFTTNFDNLLETAFAAAGLELEVFDVHLRAAIPNYTLIQKKRSLIKLHGGSYGLRADYSLNALPSEEDKISFISALKQSTGSDSCQTLTKNHILVLGVSGSDLRITKLIESAIKVPKCKIKVFWVCYSKSDMDQVNILQQQIAPKEPSPTYESPILPLHHSFLGVLLLQLYQYLTHSLPPAGIVFPSSPFLPFPTVHSHAPKDDSDIHLEENKLLDAIKQQITGHPEKRRLLVYSSKTDVTGITTVASKVYYRLMEESYNVLWQDLDDVADVDELFEQIVHAISRKSGVSNWMPVLLKRYNRGYAREITQYTKNGQRDWILFLHARQGVATNIDGLQCPQEGNTPNNGWLDFSRDREEKERTDYEERFRTPRLPSPFNMEAFSSLVMEITGQQCKKLTIVLLCWDGLLTTFLKENYEVETRRLDNTVNKFDPKKISKKAVDVDLWSNENGESETEKEQLDSTKATKIRFLHALCSMRRTRYPAVFWSWAFHGSLDRFESSEQTAIKVDTTKTWLSYLERSRVIRRKPGGFVWMHAQISRLVKAKLEKHMCPANSTTSYLSQNQEVEHGLADTYEKLYVSSCDPMFALEAAIHRCYAALNSLRIASNPSGHVSGSSQEYLIHAHNFLHAACTILVQAKQQMLSSGFTRTICRKLLFVRSECLDAITTELSNSGRLQEQKLAQDVLAVRTQISNLLLVTLRLSRAIAREISEIPVMAERNLAIAVSQANATPPTKMDLHTFSIETLLDDLPFPAKLEVLREELTLAITCRSYPYAHKCFEMMCQITKFPKDHLFEPVDTEFSVSHVLNMIFKWVVKTSNENENESVDSTHNLQELSRVLARQMQLLLCNGQLAYAIQQRKINDTENIDPCNFHRKALCCYWAVQELSNCIQPSAPENDQLLKQFLQKSCYQKQVLKTQYATACSWLGDFEQAHRRLDEAKALLSQGGYPLHCMENGIIALHRVEVLIQQALYRDGAGKKLSHLGKWRRDVLSLVFLDQIKPDGVISDFRILRENYDPKGKISNGSVFLEDAYQRLVEARQILQQNRKNVWWVTWKFEHQMKLIELEICVLSSQKGPRLTDGTSLTLPLNFLSRPQEILRNAQRMVRHDIYRLTRVTESYLRILAIFFLTIRTNKSLQGHDFAGVLGMLRDGEVSIKELKETYEERKRLHIARSLPPLDENIEKYVDLVMDTHGPAILRLCQKLSSEF